MKAEIRKIENFLFDKSFRIDQFSAERFELTFKRAWVNIEKLCLDLSFHDLDYNPKSLAGSVERCSNEFVL